MDRADDEFLKINANVDYMSRVLADVIRSCMRATASNDPRRQTYEAMTSFLTLQKLIGFSENVKAFELFEKAITHLTVNPREDSLDEAFTDAAKMGVRYLTEMSCYDGAARGRASKRLHEFLHAIDDIEIARETNRKRYQR